jgi:hypothetical protein
MRPETLLLVATLGVTALAGAQSGADERLVDVGGRRLLISCKGDTSPTVIIERGLAGNDYAPVQGPAFAGAWGRLRKSKCPFY